MEGKGEAESAVRFKRKNRVRLMFYENLCVRRFIVHINFEAYKNDPTT